MMVIEFTKNLFILTYTVLTIIPFLQYLIYYSKFFVYTNTKNRVKKLWELREGETWTLICEK